MERPQTAFEEKESKPGLLGGSKCGLLRAQTTQYCEQTSVHGFQYLAQPGIFTKIGWLAVVILSIVASVYFMAINLREYFQQIPLTYINDTTAPLTDVYFPSVTICNLNQVIV